MTDSYQDISSMHRFTCTSTPLVEEGELSSWILHEDDDVLAINKPGWLVCHPSKAGPMSSLIGAAKVYCGVERLHLVSRLDRETSGIVLIAKTHRAASQYQRAIEARRVSKSYLVWLMGELSVAQDVDQPLARDLESLVHVKQTVRKSNTSQKAQTRFEPLHYNADKGITLVRAMPHTGRKHQIRAHAKWMGYPVYGDKLYGPDDLCYLTFIEKGWTADLAAILEFPRQALHASSLHFQEIQLRTDFHAPLTTDLESLNLKLGFPVGL